MKKVTLYFWFGILRNKKSLKTPNGYSEPVNRERTDDTMSKKQVKGTNNDLQNITQKPKDRVTRILLR